MMKVGMVSLLVVKLNPFKQWFTLMVKTSVSFMQVKRLAHVGMTWVQSLEL